jgi:hypothetical protein
VWRLAGRLRLPPEHFVVARERTEGRPDSFRLTPKGARLFLALDKGGRFGAGQPCVFLMELPGGLSRCAVYNVRPLVCRVYPMSLWAGTVSPRPKPKCPSDGWLEALAANPSSRRQLQRLGMEQDLHAEVVARWNAWVDAGLRRVALRDYLDYLMAVYERLDRALEASFGSALQDIVDGWPGLPRAVTSAGQLEGQRDRAPWVRCFLAARSIIDSFFPELPAQPYALRAAAERGAGADPES